MREVRIQGIGTVFEVDDDMSEEEVSKKVKEYVASRKPDLPRTEAPPPQEPGLLATILKAGREVGPEIIGGVAGGAAMTPVGRGVQTAIKAVPYVGRSLSFLAPFVTRALGMGAGAGAGATGGALLQGESPDVAVEKGVEATGRGILGETIFGGARNLAGLVRKVIPKRGALEKYLTPGGKESIALLGAENVRPAQVVAGKGAARGVDLADSMADSSLFGADIAEHYGIQMGMLDQKVATWVKTFGKIGTPEQSGEIVELLLKGKYDASSTVRRSMFNHADELTAAQYGTKRWTEEVPSRLLGPDAKPLLKQVHKSERFIAKGGVDNGPLQRWATDQLAEVARLPASEIGTERVKLLENITKLPNTLTFGEADELLNAWSRKSVSILDPHPDTTKRFHAIAAGMMDDAMDGAGKTLGPEAIEAYRAARAFSKEHSQVFNAKLVRKLVKDLDVPDEKITELIAGTDLKTLRSIKKTLGPDGFEHFQAGFSRRLVNTASPDGELNGKKLERLLTQDSSRGGWGMDKVDEIYGKEQAEVIRKIARVTRELQKKGLPQGRLLVQMKQAGAVAGVTGAGIGFLTGSVPAGIVGSLASGAFYLGAPSVAAKAFTNGKISRHLLTGLQAPSGSKLQTEAFGRAAALLSIYALQEQDQSRADEGFTPGP